MHVNLFSSSVGADGRSELGFKLDSLGLDPTSSSQSSLTSFGDRLDDNESPEASLNRQARAGYQNRKNVPNGQKISQMSKLFQMAIKYINSFKSKALQNLLVCKRCKKCYSY
jgi:hypothetical protein